MIGNNYKNKSKFCLFFLICSLLFASCGIKNHSLFNGEDARFANYTAIGSDSAGLAYYEDETNPNEIAVAIGTCTDADIIVTKYQGRDVTSVFPSGFQNCSTIKTISLPETITAFGTDAFAGSNIESIIIPAALSSIPSGAFRNCRKLKTVDFATGNQVTSINAYAFANDYSLEVFPFHKIGNLRSIGSEAFLYCKSLGNIVFNEGFTTLSSYAFQDCKGLSIVYFPSTITSIGEFAFRGVGQNATIYFNQDRGEVLAQCNITDLDSAAPFKDNHNFSFDNYYVPIVWKVGDLKISGSFHFTNPGTYNLKKYTTGNGESDYKTDGSTEFPETIADDEVVLTFYDDHGETEIDIPSTIEWDKTYKVVGIQNQVFANQTDITKVTFHENLRFIDYQAFAGCTALTEINLQGATDLQHIQSRAFYNTMPLTNDTSTSSMRSIHIPPNVENIAVDAFRSCDALFKVYFDGATNQYEEVFICDGSTSSFELPYYPNSISSVRVGGSTEAYNLSGKTITLTEAPVSSAVVRVKYTTNSTTTQTFVGEGDVSDFYLSCLADAIGVVEVNGEQLSNDAYASSNYLDGTITKTKITFNTAPDEDAVISISYRALPKLVRIHAYAFEDCFNDRHGLSFGASYSLKEMDHPYQNVYFPSSLNYIERRAFASSQIVGGAIFKSQSLTLEEYAFYSEEGLSAIEFPTTMTNLTIYGNCFASGINNRNEYAAGSYFKKLTSVTLPSNTVVGGNDIFAGHIFLSIYCIGNEPSVINSSDSWNFIATGTESTFVDYSTSSDNDYAPTYVVDSADDIVSLPSKEFPIFDFVKEKGKTNEVTLTRYHFNGSHLKDQDGDPAIVLGASPNSTNKRSINSNYNSEYAVLLDNGHFRAEVPAIVYVGSNPCSVTKIGEKALWIQINKSNNHPKTKGSEGHNYWKDDSNFWTMREITLPNSVKEIAKSALSVVPFATLKSYDASNSKIASDGSSMIWDNTKAISDNGVFPASLEILGTRACSFSALTNASLPNSLISFGGVSSSSAANDDSFKYFPFIGCFDLGNITMYGSGSSIFSAGGGVLTYTRNNTETMLEGAEGIGSIMIPWGTQGMVAGALRGGRKIQTVTFPYTLKKIANYFIDAIGSATDPSGAYNGNKLNTVSFSNASEYSQVDDSQLSITTSQCTEIGNAAFWGCNISSMEFPKNLQKLGAEAFEECKNLQNISVDQGTQGAPNYESVDPINCGSHLNFTNLESLTTIGKECFLKNEKLTAVTTSSSITGLTSDSIFSGCTGLTNVNLHQNTKTLGKLIFNGCSSLTTVTFNSTTTLSLGESSFNGCGALNSISFAGANVTFGKTAFQNCTSLKKITIPANSIIGVNSFKNCTGLDDDGLNGGVIVKAGCSFSKDQPFQGCPEGTHIFIEETDTTYASARSGGGATTRYPDGWNQLSQGGNTIEPYLFAETEDDITQSAFKHWRWLNGVVGGTPEIWES
ncbi:MAG: leucine-rich repeat domain-containing protein [Bacilli bacterium]|nr:leucine-rich repeat domain-containing protein [Bacilli bacterium]